MSDETPDVEETEDPTSDEASAEETDKETEEGPQSYIRYTASPRRGSIWNSPIGLVVVGILVSKGMDLAYRAFIEREKTRRAELEIEHP